LSFFHLVSKKYLKMLSQHPTVDPHLRHQISFKFQRYMRKHHLNPSIIFTCSTVCLPICAIDRAPPQAVAAAHPMPQPWQQGVAAPLPKQSAALCRFVFPQVLECDSAFCFYV
jgi:hypothetical protein